MRILIVEDKHGTFYYDASTEEKLGKSALAILEARMNQGWYCKPELKHYYYKIDEETFLTGEQIDDLPEHLQAAELNKLKKKKNAERQLLEDLEWWNEVQELIESGDPKIVTYERRRGPFTTSRAWELLYQHSNYEYEHVTLEDLIEVE